MPPAQGAQRVLEPADAPSLAQRERARRPGPGFQRQAELGAQLGLEGEGVPHEPLGERLQPRQRIGRGRRPEQGLRLELGVRRGQQRALVGEVAEGGGARDGGPVGGPLDGRRDALREQLPRRRDEGGAGARLLVRPARALVGG